MRAAMSCVACLVLGCLGCAHHKADQYVFAPPYAPPVYPQPAAPQQMAAAPAVAAPPAITGVPGPAMAGPAGAPCGPTGQPGMTQGSPCPPGEYIVPGSVVGGEMPCDGVGGAVIVGAHATPCEPAP